MSPVARKPDYPKILRYLIVWMLINLFFGFLPTFIALCLHLEVNSREAITDCVVSFFCIAQMGSVFCDYLISKYKPGKYEQMFIFVTPLLLLSMMNPIYTKVQILNPTPEDIVLLEHLQALAILVASVYCISFKVLMLAKEIKK